MVAITFRDSFMVHMFIGSHQNDGVFANGMDSAHLLVY
jgi:hypothetical protein